MHYAVEPQVNGELVGGGLEMSGPCPRVTQGELELDFGDCDDLLECFPGLFVRSGLAERLLASGFSGFVIEPLVVTVSDQDTGFWADPHARPPSFVSLVVVGGPEDDCWRDGDRVVCVSERMWRVLVTGRLALCDYEEREPETI